MKNKLRLFIYFVLIIASFAFIYYSAQTLYTQGSFTTINDIMTFSIGVISLIISVVALMISLSTYFSIDAVNAMSSMEGNVLCNENYNAEYQILVDKYSHCRNQTELENQLYQTLSTNLKKNSKTCMQFTDCIQDLLDHILWYAYTDSKTEVYKKHIIDLVTLLDKRFGQFNAISNGNQYLLTEHIKLIKNVLNYQSIAHEGGELIKESSMLNIRGRLFQNAVSKTIYYDYLGLEYHKKALKLLREDTGFEKEEFLLDSMALIQSTQLTSDRMHELEIYLGKAKEAFQAASDSSQDDILWKGYISFNKARVDLLVALVNKEFPDKWDNSISEAIDARYTVLKLLAPENEESFLLAEFNKEYYYAKALHLIVRAYLVKDSETELAEIKSEAQDILNTLPSVEHENGSIFARTRSYLLDILK